MRDAQDVALLRLVAQRLVGPPLAGPADAVRHLAAVQAQDEAGALLSVALRCGDTREAVRSAFDAGELARSWPMRGTLHTVAAEDLPWMVELMTPRPRAASAKRRWQLDLDEDDVARARELAEAALAGTALTRAELLAVWDDAGLGTASGRGYHLIAELAQRGVLCLGPYRGTEQCFVLVAEHVREPRRLDGDAALAELALRFLTGHGPATAADLARWASLPLGSVRRGIAAVREQLTAVEVEGTEYLLAPQTLDAYADLRTTARRSILLVPGFDELILGYADRTMTLAAEHADRVVPGGNGVFRPTVVVGGRAVAVWRTAGTGRNRRLEVDPFDDAGLPPRVLAAAEKRWAALP
ncbi:hypothetical protein AFE02nite_34090 [Actinotalea fermentans]|uniref:Winged helix DNA-binding domain-containing protein n=1 Tax=Actinotalea fermentans TaxID=43671 RepID=A0A511Z2J9_9CELL|nr:hypothetical protein AFE02nite_34090 [Actinotalea fermentans]